jgi:hypothetical protein
VNWQSRLSLKPGDKVRLSRELAEQMSDPETAKARGRVKEVQDWGDRTVATVAWDRAGMPEEVNVLHLRGVREREK